MSGDVATGVVISDVLNTFALLTPAAREHVRALWADAGIDFPAHEPHRARSILWKATGVDRAAELEAAR